MLQRSALLARLIAVLLCGTAVSQRPHRDLVWDLPPWILSRPYLPLDEVIGRGYLDVTEYDGWNGNPVDPTGTKDSTLAIQKAIEDARVYNLVLLFRPGTYSISDTLSVGQRAIRYQTKLMGTYTRNTVLIGYPGVVRPVIRLRDFSPGFQVAAKPKALVHIWAEDPNKPVTGSPKSNEGNSWGFNQVFRGIDLDVGKGNPGAAGIYFAAAEGSTLEDVTIQASGGAIGIMGLPGRSMTTMNVRIVGGQIGIRSYTTPSPVLIGITLENQTQTAVDLRTWTPLTMVGFKIIKSRGPVITMPPSNQANASHLALIDGTIQLASGGSGIDNLADRNLYLENVFFRGASPLVSQRTDRSVVAVTAGWNHVTQFANCSRLVLKGHRFACLEDHDSIPVLLETGFGDPPPDLITKHLPLAIPNPFLAAIDVRQLGVAGDGITDDTRAIQAAIDANPTLFFPKGDYLISNTLVLHADTALIGIAKNLARLTVSSVWKPTKETAILLTDDDPRGKTILTEIGIRYPYDQPATDHFNILTWRVGRHSIVKGFQDLHQYWSRSTTTNPHSMYRIQGSGGGRWYGWHSARFQRNRNSGFRIMTIDGTKEPLTFYGFESQDTYFGRKNPSGLLSSPFNEIRNARNIRIFGSKSESGQTYLTIRNSANISFIGHGGHAQTRSGSALFEVDRASRNIILWGLGISDASFPYVSGSLTLSVQALNNSVIKVGANDLLGTYRRGTLDPGAWR